MKNFLKQNWFKIIIGLACFFVGIAIFSYFLIYIPQKDHQAQLEKNRKELDEKISECRELGTEFIEKYKKENSNKVSIVNPIFHYNEKLNTCFLKSGYWGNQYYEFIKDLNTNRVIIDYTHVFNPNMIEEERKRDNQKYDELKHKFTELFEMAY